ncbi:unnamed protein product [Victoria cruziana]
MENRSCGLAFLQINRSLPSSRSTTSILLNGEDMQGSLRISAACQARRVSRHHHVEAVLCTRSSIDLLMR